MVLLSPVQGQVKQDVYVITLDNPPVNAISISVRRGLISAVNYFEQSNAKVAVLVGSNGTFIAGADIHEFGRSFDGPVLLDVVRVIENCKKPIVAALQGAVLGGGLEVALACDARIAHVDTVIGLPEVSLGIIPGAGGTQLLPRRIGISRSIDIICGTQRLSAEEAKNLRLVDSVVYSDVLEAATLFAKNIEHKSRVRDEQVPNEDPALIDQAINRYKKLGRCRPAIAMAIDLIQAAAKLPIEEGLVLESSAFLELRKSQEAQALRHLFFAERTCKKPPQTKEIAPIPINTVCVIGAGTMGTGIAICLLDAEFSVMLLEQNKEALDSGEERIFSHYQKQVETGKLLPIEASKCLSHLLCSLNWEELAKADLVIEAVYEDISVKQNVFGKIDKFANPNAILATNTSYLSVDKIASTTTRPKRVIGLHFFSPANVMKLLEIVDAKQTCLEVLHAGIAFGNRLNKYPVVTKDSFGFIGNRIYNAYRTQCEFMLEDGAWPEEVDAALVDFGMAMGPFTVADLSGLDIAWRMRKTQRRNQEERYVDILDTLCELGRFGRKTNAGYYDYANGKKQANTSELVRQIIENASQRRRIKRQTLSFNHIQNRALLSMVNEAALLMHEGITQRASDIDVVFVHGYGFPRWQGGPVFWARQQDRQQLQDDIAGLAQHFGNSFVPADVSILFENSP